MDAGHLRGGARRGVDVELELHLDEGPRKLATKAPAFPSAHGAFDMAVKQWKKWQDEPCRVRVRVHGEEAVVTPDAMARAERQRADEVTLVVRRSDVQEEGPRAPVVPPVEVARLKLLSEGRRDLAAARRAVERLLLEPRALGQTGRMEGVPVPEDLAWLLPLRALRGRTLPPVGETWEDFTRDCMLRGGHVVLTATQVASILDRLIRDHVRCLGRDAVSLTALEVLNEKLELVDAQVQRMAHAMEEMWERAREEYERLEQVEQAKEALAGALQGLDRIKEQLRAAERAVAFEAEQKEEEDRRLAAARAQEEAVEARLETLREQVRNAQAARRRGEEEAGRARAECEALADQARRLREKLDAGGRGTAVSGSQLRAALDEARTAKEREEDARLKARAARTRAADERRRAAEVVAEAKEARDAALRAKEEAAAELRRMGVDPEAVDRVDRELVTLERTRERLTRRLSVLRKSLDPRAPVNVGLPASVFPDAMLERLIAEGLGSSMQE